MKNISKVSRKFVLLGAMLFTLGFMSFSADLNPTVGAAPCCSECDAQRESCAELPADQQQQCYQQANRCYRWCSFSC